MIADVSLRHCSALRERHKRSIASLCAGKFHCKIDHADLRAVAMSHNDFITGLRQIHDRLSGFTNQIKLLLGGIA